MVYKFETVTGVFEVDEELCQTCEGKPCISECLQGILAVYNEYPVIKNGIDSTVIKKGKCIECMACELACQFHGKQALTFYLPIKGLK